MKDMSTSVLLRELAKRLKWYTELYDQLGGGYKCEADRNVIQEAFERADQLQTVNELKS